MLERILNRDQVFDLYKELSIEDNWYWWVEGGYPSYDKFEEWIKSSEFDPLGFFINRISIGDQSRVIGFSKFSNTNILHGFSYLTIWIRPSLRHTRGFTPYGAIASFEAIKFAFTNFPLRKIYQNVIVDNLDSFKPLSKVAFLEGRLNKHYFIKGSYRDVITFSIDRDKLDQVYKKYNTIFRKFTDPD